NSLPSIVPLGQVAPIWQARAIGAYQPLGEGAAVDIRLRVTEDDRPVDGLPCSDEAAASGGGIVEQRKARVRRQSLDEPFAERCGIIDRQQPALRLDLIFAQRIQRRTKHLAGSARRSTGGESEEPIIQDLARVTRPEEPDRIRCRATDDE